MMEFFKWLNLPMEDIMNWVIVILVLIIAWIVAKIISSFIGKWISKANFIKTIFEKIGVDLNMKILWKIISKVVFIILIFIALVAVLKYLNIEIKLVNDILDVYLPQLINAWIITIIALVLANIAKTAIKKVSDTTNLNKKIGGESNSLDLGTTLGNAGYWTIILLFLSEILSKLGQANLASKVDNVINTIISFLPNIFSAIVILGISYIVWNIISKIISELLWGLGFNKILGLFGLKNIDSKISPSEVIGKIIFVYILLLASVEAASVIGFSSFGSIVENIISFSINIFVGIIIMGLWIYIANIASSAISSASKSKILPLIAKTAIIILTWFMGLQQMGIGWDIINQAFTLTIWAVAVAFALAVGLWAKDVAWKEIEELIKKLK